MRDHAGDEREQGARPAPRSRRPTTRRPPRQPRRVPGTRAASLPPSATSARTITRLPKRSKSCPRIGDAIAPTAIATANQIEIAGHARRRDRAQNEMQSTRNRRIPPRPAHRRSHTGETPANRARRVALHLVTTARIVATGGRCERQERKRQQRGNDQHAEAGRETAARDRNATTSGPRVAPV